VTEDGDEAGDSQIPSHDERVRQQLDRLDEAMALAAAKGCDARIARQLGILRDTAMRLDDAMLAAAAAAVPDGPGLDTLLAAVSRVPAYLRMVFPEQVTDAAIAKILDALKHIDSELNDYISDRDTARLANILDTGLQNLILAVRNCIGRWQLGKGPWRIQRLDLRLGIPDIAGRPAAYPVLKILIDGTEVLAGRRCQYTG
jgi:hypothetical protein